MSMDDSEEPYDDWADARLTALEQLLGPPDEGIFHSGLPISLGGAAVVLRFRPPGMGVTYVTSELIGYDEQIVNSLGNFELMICHRDENIWGPNIISQLARYTLTAEVEPGETVDISSAVPDGSAIVALAFQTFAQFQVLEQDCGLLLCIGITADELEAYHEESSEMILELLKHRNIYPFTDLDRRSVLD